jgi:phospholipid/cholesterol/gamma-HCH transport system ATP-binding protein
MIQVKNVDKYFDDGTRQVLFDISAEFYDGKTNLIIGQSGSGKTVLMKSIVGLFHPEQGEILFDGRDITKMNNSQVKQLRKEMGMLFQGSALFDSETVMGNVKFPLMMFSGMSVAEQRERAQFCIDRVNLTGSEDKYPSELSGGMQKRAAIARAIALNPKYLFCDEPNSGLDPKTSIVIDELLSDITHEYDITTIINTHDMNSVMGIGENIVFVNKGHIGWIGDKDQIYDTDNDALNDFVFATDLFKDVRKYRVVHGYHKDK